mmetsp:Transcript_79258/g.169829  ORF Transcript_79258/g.169829 Transcript_79258/m.169829 type:complete len:277 (-) Transcript_79258:1911-2741(-)
MVHQRHLTARFHPEFVQVGAQEHSGVPTGIAPPPVDINAITHDVAGAALSMILHEDADTWSCRPRADILVLPPLGPFAAPVLDPEPAGANGLVAEAGEEAADKAWLLMQLRIADHVGVRPCRPHQEGGAEGREELPGAIMRLHALIHLHDMNALGQSRPLDGEDNFCAPKVCATEAADLAVKPGRIRHGRAHLAVKAHCHIDLLRCLGPIFHPAVRRRDGDHGWRQPPHRGRDEHKDLHGRQSQRHEARGPNLHLKSARLLNGVDEPDALWPIHPE